MGHLTTETFLSRIFRRKNGDGRAANLITREELTAEIERIISERDQHDQTLAFTPESTEPTSQGTQTSPPSTPEYTSQWTQTDDSGFGPSQEQACSQKPEYQSQWTQTDEPGFKVVSAVALEGELPALTNECIPDDITEGHDDLGGSDAGKHSSVEVLPVPSGYATEPPHVSYRIIDQQLWTQRTARCMWGNKKCIIRLPPTLVQKPQTHELSKRRPSDSSDDESLSPELPDTTASEGTDQSKPYRRILQPRRRLPLRPTPPVASVPLDAPKYEDLPFVFKHGGNC